MKGRGLALFAPAMLAFFVSAQAVPAKQSCASQASAAKQIACLINAERASRGLRALRGNQKLRRAATGHARNMVRYRHTSHFAHGRGPSDRVRGTGYLDRARSWMVGETLGWVKPGGGPGHLMWQWLGSPVHRDILMSPRFEDFGVGVADGVPSGNGAGYTVVVNLGFRRR